MERIYVLMLSFSSIKNIVCRLMQCFSSLVVTLFITFSLDVDVVLDLFLCNIISLYVTADKLRVGISKENTIVYLVIKVNHILCFIFHGYSMGDMSILSLRFSSRDRLELVSIIVHAS